MDVPTRSCNMRDAVLQHPIFKEGLITDGVRDSHQLLVHDSSGTDILMPNLTVSHDPVGQSNVFSRRSNLRMRELPQQPVIHRRAGKMDCVAVVEFRVWIVSPAVANDQNNGASFLRHVAQLDLSSTEEQQ